MKDVNTWETIKIVHTTLKELIKQCALEGIAVNFGKWETASANDESEYALDCHGHIHLHLSRKAVNILQDSAGWKAIRGRVEHPENYLDKDIHELEVRRLIPLENSVIWSEVGMFHATVGALDAKVGGLDAKVETKFAALETSVVTGFQLLMEKLDKLDKK